MIKIIVLTTGPLCCTMLLILISIRNMVTNKAVRPGTISTGITNPMNEIRVRSSVGKYVSKKNGYGNLVREIAKPVTFLLLSSS